MTELVQFVASRSGELGVQGQYLDGELHLVDDTLSGAVARTEQFEVLDSIVSTIPVNVMDSFFFEETPADILRHDVAVFEHFMLFTSDEAGYGDPNVTMSLGVLAYFAAIKFGQSACLLMRRFAFLATIFLLNVNASARFAALNVYSAAFKASESVFSFFVFAATNTRALMGAVQRIASILLVVRGREVFHHKKILAAFLASELHGCSTGCRNAFAKTVRAPARETAVLPVFARKTGEGLLAVFTDFLNRHRLVPLFGNEGTLSMSVGIVK